MKKISVLFLSVFMLMFVSCSQLFDFSAKNASVSFSIPESMMNDLRDQGATPVENSLIINIVVKDQNGKVVKSINELRQLKQFSQEILPSDYTINKLPIGSNYSISVDFFRQERGEDIYMCSAYAYGINLQPGKTTQVKMTLNEPSYFTAKVYYMDGNEEKTITMPANELKIFYEEDDSSGMNITYFGNVSKFYISTIYNSLNDAKWQSNEEMYEIKKIEYWLNEKAMIDLSDTLIFEYVDAFTDGAAPQTFDLYSENIKNNEPITLLFDSGIAPEPDNSIKIYNSYKAIDDEYDSFTPYIGCNIYKDNKDGFPFKDCVAQLHFIPFYKGITEVLSGERSISAEFEKKGDEHVITYIPIKDIIGEKYKPFINDTVMFKLQVKDKDLKDNSIFYNIFAYKPDDVRYDNYFKVINNDTVYLVFNNFTEDLYNSSLESSYLYINIQNISYEGEQDIILNYVVFPQKDNIVVFSINNEPIDADEEGSTPDESKYRYEYKYVISETTDTNWNELDKNYPIDVEFTGDLCSFSFDNPSYTPAEKSFYNVLCDSQGYYRRLSDKKPIEQDKITINNGGKYHAKYSLYIEGVSDYNDVNLYKDSYPIYFHLYSECNASDLSTLYLIKNFNIDVYNEY